MTGWPGPPIAEYGLPTGQRGERGGVGAKQSWPQTDRRNKRQIAQGVKFALRKAALRSRHNGPGGIGLLPRRRAERLGDRPRRAPFGAHQKTPPRRPAGDQRAQVERGAHLGHAQAPAPLGGFAGGEHREPGARPEAQHVAQIVRVALVEAEFVARSWSTWSRFSMRSAAIIPPTS